MIRRYRMALILLLAPPLCCAAGNRSPQDQAAPHGPTQASPSNDVRGIIPVQLSRSLDSRQLKEGQEIDARTVVALRSASGLLIPSDSKVIGHVTQATARSKGDSESSLGIVFDRIQLSNGKDVPIKGFIQALAPDPKALAGPDTGAAGSGTLAKMDGSNSATMPTPGWGPGTYPGENPGDRKVGTLLTTHSAGVVGIKNLELGNDSVLLSTSKEVKLLAGSQILIKAQ